MKGMPSISPIVPPSCKQNKYSGVSDLFKDRPVAISGGSKWQVRILKPPEQNGGRHLS